jgi:predicted fused transcriptional regulator/phosphomethylpyrimidine kinase
VNQVASLHEEANRFRVLCDMQKALDLIRDESGFFEIIPEQGANLGMAIPEATLSGDIAALDGRLVKFRKQVRQLGCIRFGANSHLARIILAAMSFDGNARAVMNLKIEALPDCIVKGLVTTEIDWNPKPSGKASNILRIGTSKDTGSVLPDVIYEKDQMGKDHKYWLLGCSATQVAHKAVRFAGLLRDRKL